MGVVYQVRHTDLEERFALKVLRHTGKLDPSTEQRFHREARAAATLRCEHAVRVIDFGHLEDGSPFFVMELVEGANLAMLLRQRGTLPLEEALRAALHACAALAEAHALGIVHRDLKPANLLLTSRSDGSPLVKLADFGIAKLLTASSLTETHAALGSPAYMAPEQIRDARVADPRSDVWSLGVTLQELLCGQTPFHAFTAPGILSRVLTEDPTPLRALNPSLPEEVYVAVERCLHKDPSQRFPSVLDLADALGPLATEPGEAARVRRIAAFARRTPPPEPSSETPPAAGQITEVPTSLTQAHERPGVPIPASTAPAPTRAPSRHVPRVVAGLALALLAPFVLRIFLRSSPAPSAGPAVPSATAVTTAPPSAVAPPGAAALASENASSSAALPAVILASASPSQSSPKAPGAAPSPPRTSAPPPRPLRPPTHDQPPQLGDFGSRQ